MINRFIVTSFSATVDQRESGLPPPPGQFSFESGLITLVCANGSSKL
jgi:hypothetical protein